MKRFLLPLLICLGFAAQAQNWQSVRQHDTTYYTVPAANDYLRVIWIDSVTTSGTDSIFHFYPSVRLGNTTSNCLDTLGPTWLGKNFIKKATGDELFFNRWLDTITLKPMATLNTTWVMHMDTSNNEFRATITSVDTMTIDNQLDSIKELTMTVFNNNVPVTTHTHHNRKMVLSKEHGFVDCLEWYGFPKDVNNQIFPEVFLTFSHNHIRLNSTYYAQKPYYEDLNLKYQVGNYWQHSYQHKMGPHAPFRIPFINRVQDSIIQIHQTFPDSIEVSFVRKRFTIWTQNMLPDSTSKTIDTIRNMVYSQPNNKKLSEITPELSSRSLYPEYISSKYYLSTLHCDKISLSVSQSSFAVMDPNQTNCYTIVRPFGNTYDYFTEYWSGFGELSKNSVGVNLGGTSSDPYPYQETFEFAKLGNCTTGTALNFIVLNSEDIILNLDLDIHPNPANNKIIFATTDNSKIENATLFSIQGKQISACQNCNELNTTVIANGLYILHIKTDKGIARKKIVVQH